MALSAGDVPTMYAVLANSLSADEATRHPAESALAQCEPRPGFCSCLLEIISSRGSSCREDVRLLATVYFKNSINRYWRTRRDSYGISNEEKDHLRKNLLLNIREENNQIALQLAVLISKIARLDYPREWRDLFSILAQQLQSADVLASHRVFMVLFRTLKELSTKRLAVDQRNYAEITSHLFEYTWNLWKSDVQTILQNLSMLAQRNDLDSILEQSNDLILICDRWLLCLKIIRQLIFSGYASDSTTAQEVWQVREVCPTVLSAIQSLLPYYSSFKDKQAKLWDFAKRACTKLMKVLVTLQGRHPYSFVHQTVLPATVDFCLNIITNPEQAGASFEEFLIQCMVLVKSVSECKEYKPSATGRVINESTQPLSLEQKKKNFAAVASDMLKVVLPGDRVVLLCNILIRRYFIYTAKDLEEWSENPESFHHEQNLVQWTEKQRPCAEALFIVIFENYRELLAPVVVSILREAMSVSPPLETDVTSGMLLKDAAYTAAGHVYYELSNYLSFNEWFHGSLSIEISNGHPNMRIIRRKVALLLGQWISEIKGDTRKLVYRALVQLLQDNDIAVRLAACSSLCYLFQESSFSELDLFECLPTCWTMCFKLTEDVQEFDSKVQVLNFISVLLEHVGDKVIPFASQLSQFFQKIWDESAGESLLQIQLLTALRTFVSSLGYQSPLSYHMLMPILQSGINVDSPDALNLLEDSVLLWEATLSNAPSIVPQLMDLFPHLVGIVNRSFDHLEVAVNIVEDYTIFGGSEFLKSHGTSLANVLDTIVGNVNDKGLLTTLPAIDLLIQLSNMSSAGSVPSPAVPVDDVDAYDPMTDPKRRAKSNDPGWKYAYWTEPGNRDKVTCNLCKTVTTGGIKRLKEHLAGGYGDTLMCSKTTTEIRREMRAYLEKNKRHRPISIDDDDEGQREQQTNDDSTASIHHPSTGTAAKKRRSLWTTAAPSQSSNKEKETAKVVTMLRRTPEQVVDDRRSSGSYQPSIEVTTKSKADRDYVNKQWAMWFYECGVPFNAINSRQFHIACEATAQYGTGYVPPSMHEVREPLLKECVKDVASMRAQHEVAWKTYGCTLMSDGWTDKRGRHLINFLVNSPEGTYFLESVDASGEQQNASLLADLLEKRIDNIGRDNVVQVVTDNGANYKAAGRLLMDRIPTLYWTPCAAHCLDLMMEDIGKLKELKKPIAQAKRVTTFIYRHGKLLHAMREKTGGDLVRPAATRFATSFLTLKSIYKNKDQLRSLFVSDTWNYNKLAKTEAGKGVCDIILAKSFWSSVEDCLRAGAPLLIVLRAVDGDERPAMPEVAALMDMVKEKIKAGFTPQNKQALLKKVLAIIEKRWVSQMDHPLYGAALYLNPGKFFAIKKKGDDRYVGELRACFNDVPAKMEPDDAIRSKIDDFAMHYEEQRGPIFANKMAIANIESKSPLDWWRAYAGRAFELQRFAKRVVSLCASSSGCERNWSTFEFLFPQEAPPLISSALQKLIFISLSRDDEHNPSRTTVRASSGAILARLLVMNTNFSAQLLSEPALLANIQQSGISLKDNLLLSLVDMWIDKVDNATAIQQKEYAMALSVVLTLQIPQVIDKLDDILSVCTTVIIGAREVKTEDDSSGDITSSSWLGNDNSGYPSKFLKKRQAKDLDPIKQASLENILRENLKACAAHHGDSTFNAAISRIHPSSFAQLQQALNSA